MILIGESAFLSHDFLCCLVPLAGQHDHVFASRRCGSPGGSRSRGLRCGAPLTRLLMPAAIWSMIDLRVLAARVVARDHHLIRELLRDRAHQRTLGRVAVAAATEHADEFAAARFGHRPQRVERLFERVGRVRVVDHDERLVVLQPAAETLHATVDRFELRDLRERGVERDAGFRAAPQSPRAVAHVERAERADFDVRLAPVRRSDETRCHSPSLARSWRAASRRLAARLQPQFRHRMQSCAACHATLRAGAGRRHRRD